MKRSSTNLSLFMEAFNCSIALLLAAETNSQQVYFTLKNIEAFVRYLNGKNVHRQITSL